MHNRLLRTALRWFPGGNKKRKPAGEVSRKSMPLTNSMDEKKADEKGFFCFKPDISRIDLFHEGHHHHHPVLHVVVGWRVAWNFPQTSFSKLPSFFPASQSVQKKQWKSFKLWIFQSPMNIKTKFGRTFFSAMAEGSQNLGCETKRIQIVLAARRTKIVLIFFYRRKKKLKRFAFPRKNEESNHNLNLPNVAGAAGRNRGKKGKHYDLISVKVVSLQRSWRDLNFFPEETLAFTWITVQEVLI